MSLSAFVFLAQGTAPPSSNPGMGGLVIPVLCFGVIFYFSILRPQNKRQKDLQTLISSLKTGDKVVTSGGIHGMVANVKDGSTLTLKVADNVKIEVDKTAIASVDRGAAGATSPAVTSANAALPAKTA